jgi:hypothetical protein
LLDVHVGPIFVLQKLSIDDENKINKSVACGEDVTRSPTACRFNNYKRRISMAGLDKRVATYEEALAGLTDNMTVLAGGFGLCGIPENLIAEIKRLASRA